MRKQLPRKQPTSYLKALTHKRSVASGKRVRTRTHAQRPSTLDTASSLTNLKFEEGLFEMRPAFLVLLFRVLVQEVLIEAFRAASSRAKCTPHSKTLGLGTYRKARSIARRQTPKKKTLNNHSLVQQPLEASKLNAQIPFACSATLIWLGSWMIFAGVGP